MVWSFIKKSAIKAGFFLVIVSILLLLVHMVGISRLTPEAIRNLIVSLGWWGPVVFVLLYTLRPLLLFPAIILTLAGGLAFGPWWGTFYVVLGGLSGACLCFWLARLMGKESMRRYFGRYVKLEQWDAKTQEHGFKTMLVMRVVPIFPYDPVSFLAGVSNIRFSEYALATAIGMIPGAFAYNVLGYSMTEMFSPLFLAALLLVALVMFTPMIYHFIKNNYINKENQA